MRALVCLVGMPLSTSLCHCVRLCGFVTMFPWRSGHENVSEDNNKVKLSYKTVGTAYSPINVPPEGFEFFFCFKENLVEDLLYNTL